MTRTSREDYRDRWQAQEQNSVAVALAKMIRDHRKARNLSQRELATRAGLHQSAVSEMESGYRILTIPTLARLAHAMGTELSISLIPAEPDDVGYDEPRQGQ